MKPLSQNTLIENRYLVVHLIGKGGMGEVYLAVDQRLGSAVALKRTYFAGDAVLAGAFEREARTLARMRHPVLPKVSDHFGEGDEQFLVMEHIAGDDLAKRLEAAQKPFPVSWVMFWADQLLDALSYLHSHEPAIIHRDIKPQNLKLTDENHIILLDFGLSKTTTGQTNISRSGSTGSVVGYTPHYAPMEQIRGIGTNARSDIYSLSATLYQLMTNVVPADALTRADVMLNGMADPIEPPHLLNPEIPATVSEVILKGMEVSQEKRFSTARETQKALRKAFTQMQEAMAAQTVAFNIGEMLPAEPDLSGVIEKTQLMPTEPLEAAAPVQQPPASAPVMNGEPDFDETLAFDAVDEIEPAEQLPFSSEITAKPVESNGVIADPIPVDQDSFSPDAQDSFVTVAAGAGSAAFSEYQLPRNDVAEQPKPPARSRGKAFAVVGGLAALLVLGIGAAGAGWYYYSNYYATAVAAEPSPSPADTPVPAPTFEAAAQTTTDTTSNTDNASASDANATASEVPARTNSEASAQRPTASTSRPTATRPTITTAPKSTPKPKSNPGRTDILQ